MDATAENTVSRYQSWLQVHAMSQTAGAKRIGCSAATLSQIFSGSYAGDTSRYVEKMARALDRDARRASAPKRPPICVTSVVEEVLAAIQTAHDEGVMAVIMGPSGVGKTSAARLYCQAEPETVLVTHRPGARRATHGGGRTCLVPIARALGIEYCPSTSQGDLVEAIGRSLAETPRLIIMDEIDYATEAQLQCLRMAQDMSQTGMVLLGTPSFVTNLRKRRTATIDQVLNRFAYCSCLRPITDEDVERICAPYDLDRKALASARVGAQGVARRLVYALLGAQRLAASNGGKLAADHIAHAYSQLMEI